MKEQQGQTAKHITQIYLQMNQDSPFTEQVIIQKVYALRKQMRCNESNNQQDSTLQLKKKEQMHYKSPQEKYNCVILDTPSHPCDVCRTIRFKSQLHRLSKRCTNTLLRISIDGHFEQMQSILSCNQCT